MLAAPDAQIALNLARRLENTTDSAAPAISRELSRVIASALASAGSAGDPVDEVKARRDAKRDRAAAG